MNMHALHGGGMGGLMLIALIFAVIFILATSGSDKS